MNTIVTVVCIALVLAFVFLVLIGVIHLGFAEFCLALIGLLSLVCVYFIIRIKRMK